MERILENGEEPFTCTETLKSNGLNDVTDEIKRLMIGNVLERPTAQANGPSSSENDLKIKFQYMEEQAALNLKRPVSYSMLQDYFQRRFRRHLNIYYTTSSREIVIQVQNQTDLDNVIDLYERSGSKRRMRFILVIVGSVKKKLLFDCFQARKRDTDELRQTSSAAPPHGLYHGIQESTLSETSSIFSTGSTSYSSSAPNRLNHRFSSDGDENSPRIKTPNPPMNWYLRLFAFKMLSLGEKVDVLVAECSVMFICV